MLLFYHGYTIKGYCFVKSRYNVAAYFSLWSSLCAKVVCATLSERFLDHMDYRLQYMQAPLPAVGFLEKSKKYVFHSILFESDHEGPYTY